MHNLNGSKSKNDGVFTKHFYRETRLVHPDKYFIYKLLGVGWPLAQSVFTDEN